MYRYILIFFLNKPKLYILPRTSSPNSTRCAKETTKDTQSQSVKAKHNKTISRCLDK